MLNKWWNLRFNTLAWCWLLTPPKNFHQRLTLCWGGGGGGGGGFTFLVCCLFFWEKFQGSKTGWLFKFCLCVIITLKGALKRPNDTCHWLPEWLAVVRCYSNKQLVPNLFVSKIEFQLREAGRDYHLNCTEKQKWNDIFKTQHNSIMCMFQVHSCSRLERHNGKNAEQGNKPIVCCWVKHGKCLQKKKILVFLWRTFCLTCDDMNRWKIRT